MAAGLGTAAASDPRLGTLPPGSASTSFTGGVQAEICRDHLFDPALRPVRLPNGYRLLRAEELAASNPGLAALLRKSPSLGQHASGSLCFMSIREFVVDGTPVLSSRPMAAAFWWAAAQGPRAPEMKGSATYVQVGSWYARGTPHAERIARTDPMARFVEIDVDETGRNKWRLRLALDEETVTAEIQAQAESTPGKGQGPGFMSVPMSGDSAEYFSVFTYAGHRHRKAEGTWRAAGSGPFTQAFSLPEEASAFGTVFQDSWVALSGLYRFPRAPANP